MRYAVHRITVYPVTEEGRAEYGLDPGENTTGLFAFDQFIGDPERWNQGLGTRAVSLLVTYLFQKKAARKIVIDPRARNPRAIRCYEKCGFHKVKLLPKKELHEGKMEDCWLMVTEAGGDEKETENLTR